MIGRKRVAKEPEVEEEEAFPRGGGSLLTPLERRQVQQDAREDAEREMRSGAHKGKRHKVRGRGQGLFKGAPPPPSAGSRRRAAFEACKPSGPAA
jgi:hypothetical protein